MPNLFRWPSRRTVALTPAADGSPDASQRSCPVPESDDSTNAAAPNVTVTATSVAPASPSGIPSRRREDSSPVTPRRRRDSFDSSSSDWDTSSIPSGDGKSRSLSNNGDEQNAGSTHHVIFKSRTGIKKVKKLQPVPKGTLYDSDEDERIVRFILQEDAINRIKGRAFWQEAEAAYASGYNRTWQSLKNRFLKNIVPKLNTFECLTDQDRKQIIRILNN